MNRIEKICSYIDECETFVDVGCDHGYCTLYALKNKKCKSAIIADVSQKCLAKAEKLLSEYINKGLCKSVLCDGLTGIPPCNEQVLIAGMGGMEIIKILSESYIPEKFIFQPMKNAEKLRRYLIENGCEICVDDIFFDEKYYFIIKGKRCGGVEKYSQEQLAFGRDSLKNPVFADYSQSELEKLSAYGQSPSVTAKIELLKRAVAVK